MRALAALALLTALAAPAEANDWQTLFDGKSLAAFRCYNKPDIPAGIWSIEPDGSLKTVPGIKNGCDLITRDKYKDVEFELEWKVPAKGNSGIVYRVVEVPGKPSWNQGPEMQILDDAGHRVGLTANHTAGALYDLVGPSETAARPAGEWNQARLVMKGNHVEHWLNGKKVVDLDLAAAEAKAKIAASKFNSMPKFATLPKGRIALQDHGDAVWFRSLRIRRG